MSGHGPVDWLMEKASALFHPAPPLTSAGLPVNAAAECITPASARQNRLFLFPQAHEAKEALLGKSHEAQESAREAADTAADKARVARRAHACAAASLAALSLLLFSVPVVPAAVLMRVPPLHAGARGARVGRGHSPRGEGLGHGPRALRCRLRPRQGATRCAKRRLDGNNNSHLPPPAALLSSHRAAKHDALQR